MNEKQELNKEVFTHEYEVIHMLTEAQQKAVDEYKKNNGKNLDRNTWQQIYTIRKNCLTIIENYEEALRLYIELTK